jgi:hypothetical protein
MAVPADVAGGFTAWDRLAITRVLRGWAGLERAIARMPESDVQDVLAEIDALPPRDWVAAQLGVELEPDQPDEIRDTLAGLAKRRLASLQERKSVRSGATKRPVRIDRIKAMVSVTRVAEQHTTLRPAGPGRMKGLCPIHDERTPSFTVYADRERWHCFGACGRGGDVIDLARELLEVGKW